MLIAGALPNDADGLELLLSSRRLRPDVSVRPGGEPPHRDRDRGHPAGGGGLRGHPLLPGATPERDRGAGMHSADLRRRCRASGSSPRTSMAELVASRAPSMLRPLELARAAARSDTPVLLLGETGTGKELLARAIHFSSVRGSHPVRPRENRAALPRDLLRASRSATARARSAGRSGGPPRPVPGREPRDYLPGRSGTSLRRCSTEAPARAGGRRDPAGGGLDRLHVDARVIAASNCSLQEMRDGLMREDLFYRLSILVIELPPLRHRLRTCPLLVPRLLARFSGNRNALPAPSTPTPSRLSGPPCRANIQLENLLHAAVPGVLPLSGAW